ncbi:MAG: rod shape-determining protein MreD [Patescibacteria group bacterium]
MIKNSLFALLIIFIALCYLSFTQTFDVLDLLIHLPLVLSVFITVYYGYDRGYVFALGSGIILDIYGSSIFGTYTIAMILPVIVIYSSFRRLFARKSLYSLIVLMMASTIVYHATVWALTVLYFWFGWREFGAPSLVSLAPGILYQTVTHIILVISLFGVFRMVSARFGAQFRLSPRV